MTERWKAVVGFEGLYEVSDRGRLRSLTRIVPSVMSKSGTRIHRGKILSLSKAPGRYVCAALCKNGIPISRDVHRLVLIAFMGLPKGKSDACHYNGDKHDNRLKNLRWASRKENFSDSKRLGTISQGEHHYGAKLTNNDVRDIRKILGKRKTTRAPYGSIAVVAARYGLSGTTIAAVAYRKTWKHIT